MACVTSFKRILNVGGQWPTSLTRTGTHLLWRANGCFTMLLATTQVGERCKPIELSPTTVHQLSLRMCVAATHHFVTSINLLYSSPTIWALPAVVLLPCLNLIMLSCSLLQLIYSHTLPACPSLPSFAKLIHLITSAPIMKGPAMAQGTERFLAIGAIYTCAVSDRRDHPLSAVDTGQSS